MNRIDQLVENYRSHIQMPFRPGLAAPQRVWFAVYPLEEIFPGARILYV